jgi:arsenate reductase (thioredoxin)
MKILFLCHSNSALSPMAQGLAQRIGGVHHTYFSAGMAPTALNPLALRAMQEVGIDITHSYAKGLDAVPLAEMDCVFALSEEVDFVEGPNAETLFWFQPDPEKVGGTEQEQMDAFRSVRDALVPKVRLLLLKENHKSVS